MAKPKYYNVFSRFQKRNIFKSKHICDLQAEKEAIKVKFKTS